MDYWPMAREYSVWNAAVAALQFWTADLEAHVLSNAIEEVYTTFFYSTLAQILHQQCDKTLFSHFVTTLNATFESKLALEDKDYENGLENFNIPPPIKEHPRFTTFPASRMPLSTQFQLHHAVSENLASDLYAED